MSEQIETRQETTLRDFLNVVFRRKWVIVAVVGLATALVFYLNSRRPQLYESSARILVKRGEQSDILTGSVRYLSWAEEVSSQIEVILSEQVFEKAKSIFADSVASGGHPASWKFVPAGVRADVVGESNVFVIRYISLIPGVCKLGCNSMTEAFQNYYRERRAPPDVLSDFFAEEITDVRGDIEYWAKRRTDFLNKKKFFGMDQESRFLLQKITNLEFDLLDVNGKVSEQAMKVRAFEKLMNRSGEELQGQLALPMSTNLLQSVIVRDIKTSLQRLNIQKEDLLHQYTERHPGVIAIEEQIADLLVQLKQEVTNAHTVEKAKLSALEDRAESVHAELLRNQKALDEIPDKDQELTQLDSQLGDLRTRYDMLLRKQSESEIALASRPEWEVTVLSRAGNPYSKKASDYIRLALGPMLATVIALGLAFFLESMDHSVKNTAEAEEYLSARVLATISELKR